MELFDGLEAAPGFQLQPMQLSLTIEVSTSFQVVHSTTTDSETVNHKRPARNTKNTAQRSKKFQLEKSTLLWGHSFNPKRSLHCFLHCGGWVQQVSEALSPIIEINFLIII